MKKALLGLTLLFSTIGIAVAAEEQPAANMAAPTVNKLLAAQNIVVKTPRIHLIQSSANSAGVFMELDNKGAQVATLIAANSMTARQVLLHKQVTRDGEQTLEKVDKIIIKPHADTELQPTGFQVTLMGLKQTLHKGDAVPILLIFSDGSSLTVKATVPK